MKLRILNNYNYRYFIVKLITLVSSFFKLNVTYICFLSRLNIDIGYSDKHFSFIQEVD